MKRLIGFTAFALMIGAGMAHAQYSDGAIKIGVMNDMSGLYSDISGQRAVVAARMAVEDFGAAAKGLKVEILAADHQNNPLFGKGTIRVDGRKIHDMFLYEVKKPEESKAAWDYYKLRATIPATEAFRPLKEGGCPLVSG